MILGLLKSIGVNSTFFYQFAAFMITYLIIHFVAFKKYVWAYSERQQRTVGDQSKAKSMLDEVDEMTQEYQVEARKLNDQIMNIFGSQKEKTNLEYDSKIDTAKKAAEITKTSGLDDVAADFNKAKVELSKFTNELASLIEVKISGGKQ
jgi:F0F1-type ATP synthase membrane subunit b/b'